MAQQLTLKILKNVVLIGLFLFIILVVTTIDFSVQLTF